MKSTKYQLKNGLKVLSVESHKSPVITAQVWVKTGSADESKGEEGISHFIEHLVFKGTPKYNVGEIAAKVEGDGGELNAYTSFDQTVFHVTISTNFQETALDVLSQMLGYPSFDEDEINNEREVVIEEIKRSEDNLHRQAGRALFSTVYRKHPYGIPVIGYAENIRSVTKEQIVDYYNRRYTPENMTLVIVGDFKSQVMKALVKKYFSEIPRTKLVRAKRVKEPDQKRSRVKINTGPFEETLMHLAWRTPSAAHKDAAGLDVLSMILGSGDSSRLMQALRIQRGLTNYAACSTFTPKDKGFFAISVSLILEKHKLALDELLVQLEQILTEAPTPEELEKIVTNLECDEHYSTQTVDGLASKFGSYEDLFGDYRYYEKFLLDVQLLKPEDITKLARKYLKPETLTAIILTSKTGAGIEPSVKAFNAKYKKLFAKAKLKKIKSVQPSKKKKVNWLNPRIKKHVFSSFKLDSGARVVIQTNDDTPVVSLKSAFLGGMRIEKDSEGGITEILSRTWVSNTKELSEKDLHQKLESAASSISAFGGRNTVGLGVTTLLPMSNEILDLYEQILVESRLENSVVTREAEQVIEQLKSRGDNPAQICMLSFLASMFKSHPYSRDPMGSIESVSKLNGKMLKEHLNKMLFSRNMSIVVVGNIKVDSWLERLNQITSKLNVGKSVDSSFKFLAPTEVIREYKFSEKEQSHIMLGYPGLSFKDKRRHALQIIQAILSGQGGRLFYNLRDKESLAYTVSPMRMEGIDAGYFGGYIACSPEKSQKAISMLRKEFQTLREIKVSELELERAKRYLIGKHDIDLQKPAAISSAILFDEIYGLDYDETYKFADQISAVTTKDIMSLAIEIFSKPEVISVVGKTCPW